MPISIDTTNIISTDKYWKFGKIFIFHDDFNEPLDNYVELIADCEILIFSNYCKWRPTLETNNINESRYYSNKTRFWE